MIDWEADGTLALLVVASRLNVDVLSFSCPATVTSIVSPEGRAPSHSRQLADVYPSTRMAILVST